MTKLYGMAALALMGVGAFATSGTVGIKPGRYSVTTVMTMNGNKVTPNTQTRCISSADLEDPERIFNERFFDDFNPDSNCTKSNLKVSGGELWYDLECAAPPISARAVHVAATISETGYTAVRSVKPKSRRAQPFTYSIAAKRTGDCAH